MGLAAPGSAGVAGPPLRRFVLLAAATRLSWAGHNVAIGAVFGATIPRTPLVAIALIAQRPTLLAATKKPQLIDSSNNYCLHR